MGICGSKPTEKKGEKYKDAEVEVDHNKNDTAMKGDNSHFDNLESFLNAGD
jgi:hypothetical protein